jgi:phospholipase C
MSVNFANSNIKHVFVLMLENRSYDHMLGFLNADISQFSNNDISGKPYPAKRGAQNVMPCDPGHEFLDVMEQLCGKAARNAYMNDGTYPPVNNSGFVTDYADLIAGKKDGGGVAEIMRCYDTTNQLPVMAALANNFAVCNNWYSSLPGPTWPNRFFVHAASSAGLDHSPSILQITKWEILSGFSFPNSGFSRITNNTSFTGEGISHWLVPFQA